MTTENQTPHLGVDRAALRLNQAAVIGLLLIGFLVESVALVAAVGVMLAVSAAYPALAPIPWLYRRWLRGRLLQPDVVRESPAPHRFAQVLGAVTLGLATAALLLGATLLGWALVWLVIALAAINLGLGFCAGCFLYLQFARLRAR